MDAFQRLAMSGLLAFVSFVLAFPVSCGALVLWNEHHAGDVGANGPFAVLGGMVLAGVLALLTAVAVWNALRPR